MLPLTQECTNYNHNVQLSLQQYEEALAALSLHGGDGVRLTCQNCATAFWVRLPKEPSHFFSQISFSCPAACGYYGELSTLAPEQATDVSEFDRVLSCGCGLEFAANGAVLRKPCCGIETPRELMGDFVKSVCEKACGSQSRAELESFLERLVATFDGVMRRMVEIAHSNERVWGVGTEILQLPSFSSFQNLNGARMRLLSANFDMSALASDWENLNRLFQKRHVLAHRLGVVDEEYIAKSGDKTVLLGKKIPLSMAEIKSGAEDCHRIVVAFFGFFLS